MGNRSMHRAKRNKNDEFYTQYVDIKNEVDNYWEQLKGKVVYCNTDNYKESNFVKYFIDNFSKIQLKKLISLDLDGNYFEYDGERKQYSKFENGDFRDSYSTDILKGVDVVCTNPPFSLFREYVAQLIEHEKEFLIIGNNNAITYKEIFPLIKDNKMWLGHHANKAMEFALPDDYGRWDRIENGIKYGKVPAISWFTNLEIKKHQKPIPLTKKYKNNEHKYPKYDNYNAIEVSRVADIPMDYEGIMGVPITYLTKHNPEQFEIIGITNGRSDFDVVSHPTIRYTNCVQHNADGSRTNGSKINTRATLPVQDINKHTGVYYTSDTNDKVLKLVYARILIRNKFSKSTSEEG